MVAAAPFSFGQLRLRVCGLAQPCEGRISAIGKSRALHRIDSQIPRARMSISIPPIMTSNSKPARNRRDLRPTAIDLFSGCGGLSLGLRRAGFTVIAAVDLDPLACATYRMNHKRTQLLQQSIVEVDPEALMLTLGLEEGELSLLAGCPPCQGFSTLRTLNGRKRVVEPMNDLVFECSRFIGVFKPKTVMIENVPGLARDPRLKRFTKSLAAMGYKFRFDVFDAADFGVPQRRRRMILIAAREERPEFAAPAKRRADVWSAIAALPLPGSANDPAHDHPAERASHVMDLIRKIPEGWRRPNRPRGRSSASVPSQV